MKNTVEEMSSFLKKERDVKRIQLAENIIKEKFEQEISLLNYIKKNNFSENILNIILRKEEKVFVCFIDLNFESEEYSLFKSDFLTLKLINYFNKFSNVSDISFFLLTEKTILNYQVDEIYKVLDENLKNEEYKQELDEIYKALDENLKKDVFIYNVEYSEKDIFIS